MSKKKKYLLFAILITSIGIILRVFHLGSHSFWCDEFLSIFLGKHSLQWMVNYITFKDAHPPLFYAIVHFMLKGGNSEIYLRLLPAFFGVLCIPASYYLGKELISEKGGLLLALTVIFNPAHILWSQILKSYTMFTLFVIISLYFFMKILKEDKNFYWFLLFLSNLILLYLHNFAFILILIEGTALIIDKKFNKKWFAYHLLLFLLYLPWLLKIPHQFHFTLGVRRQIPLLYKFIYHFFYFFLGETVNPFYFLLVIPVFLLLSFLFIRGLWNLAGIEKEKRNLILPGLIFPLFLIPFPSTVPQNLIPFSIFWYILMISGMRNLKFRRIPLLFLIFFFSFSIYFYYTGNVYQYQDVSKLAPYRETGNFLTQVTAQKDVIIVNERRQFPGQEPFSAFDWYYSGKAKVIEGTEEKIKKVEEFERLLKTYKKIWIFLNFNEDPEWCEMLKRYFSGNYKNVFVRKYLWNERILQKIRKNGKKEQYYYFIELYCYEKKGSR